MLPQEVFQQGAVGCEFLLVNAARILAASRGEGRPASWIMVLQAVGTPFFLRGENRGVDARLYLTTPRYPSFVARLDMLLQIGDRRKTLGALETVDRDALGIFGYALEVVQCHVRYFHTGVGTSLAVILALELPESGRVPTVAAVLRNTQRPMCLTAACQTIIPNHVDRREQADELRTTHVEDG